MQTREIGEPVTLFSDWWDTTLTPVEPSAITLTLTHPDGTVDTWNKAALTGTAGSPPDATLDHWERVAVPDADGVWRYLFVGTVDGDDVEQGGIFLVGAETGAPGPCEPWTTWEALETCGTPPDLATATQEQIIDQVSEILWNLSGRAYPGICSVTRSLCFACVSCYPSGCGCDPAHGIDLGGSYPVWGAWDVTVDGVVLSPSAYTIRDRRWLVRTDGDSWPSGWDTEDPSAFAVSWAFGRQPPPGGRAAAATFALEYARLCAGQECALPQRVTSVVREGVSYTILDSMTMIAEGRVGLPTVDTWLVSDRLGRRRPHLLSPAATSVRRLA